MSDNYNHSGGSRRKSSSSKKAIEKVSSKDLEETTKKISPATEEENKARSSGNCWNNFGNGDFNDNNFGDEVVNNGTTAGGIIKVKDAAKMSGHPEGYIICEQNSDASNNEDWKNFGIGQQNKNNFGRRVVNNNGVKPCGKGRN